MFSTGEYQHVVVLVHGTFASGATWTHPDSPIARTVTKALGGSVWLESFRWSGKNSHTARLSAGADLAHKLSSLGGSHPKASLQIVAHSHGGNVAAYALRSSPDIKALVKNVVCLGTPFIVACARNLEPTLRLLRFVNVMGIVLAALFPALLAMGFIVDVVRPPRPGEIAIGFWQFLFSASVLLAMAGALSYLAISWLGRLKRYADTEMVPRLRAMQTEIVTSLQAKFDDVSVLNIQTRRDEAGLWLRFVDRFAGIPFGLWSPTLVLWTLVTGTALIAIIFALVFAIGTHGQPWTLETLSLTVAGFTLIYGGFLLTLAAVLLVITIFAHALCLFWPWLFRAHALGFGEDGFMKNWLVEISASADPPGADRTHDEELPVEGRGLRHSLLYQNESVLAAVGKWMSDDRGLVSNSTNAIDPGFGDTKNA